ncbi:MAG: S-layer homology domain-containing protein [Bifidobacteriaceae bacterium]|jgi:hypothetical protein|nr:S-layer homology domain-containing protein [Bifidobacteriaceae bacterium]
MLVFFLFLTVSFVNLPYAGAKVWVESPLPYTLFQRNGSDCMPASVGMVIHQADIPYLESVAHSHGWYNNGQTGGGADGIVGLSKMAGKKTYPIKNYDDFKHILKIGWAAVIQVNYGNTTHAMVASFFDDKTNNTYIRDPYSGKESGYKNISGLWNRKSYTGLDKGSQGTSFIGVGWYPYVGGPIGKVYESNRNLGESQTSEWGSNTGKAQTFKNGRIYWNKNLEKAYILSGGIYSKWLNNKDLGDPTSSEYNSNTGRGQIFQYGRLYWDRQKHLTYKIKDILDVFAKVGYEKYIGSPTNDIKNGYQSFQKGILNNLGKSLETKDGRQIFDVIGYNNDDNIKWLYDNNISGGTSDFTFSPFAGVSRVQMAIFLNNYLHSASDDTNCFKDIYNYSTDIKQAICGLKKLGITSGTGGGNFSPTGIVSRAQMSIFLHKTANSQGKFGVQPESNNCFSDIKTNSAKNDICWAKVNNITNGTGSNNYSPQSKTTRGQMATFIHNLVMNVLEV